MTTDIRQGLERARSRAPSPSFDLESTWQRRQRRALRHRMGAAAVALVIGGAGVAGTVVAFNGTGETGETVEPASPAAPAPALTPGRFLFRETVRFYVIECKLGGGDTQGCNLGRRDDLRDAVFAREDELAPGNPVPIPAIEPAVDRLWWSTDAEVRLWEGSPRLEFFRPGDVAGFTDLFGPRVVGSLSPEDQTFEPGEFDPPDYTFPEWSRDPETLIEEFDRATSSSAPSPVPEVPPGPGQGELTGSYVRLLTEMLPVATPDFQQALFEVGRAIEGMETISDTTDPAGRSAVALRITTEGATRSWFFDPTSHLVLGGTEVLPTSGFVWNAWYVSELAIVDSPDHRPDASESLVPPIAQRIPTLVDPRSL